MRGLVAYKLVAYKKISVANQYLVSPPVDWQMWRIFFNVNLFFKYKYVRINDYSFKYVWVVCRLKIGFYWPIFSAMSNLNSADFITANWSAEIVILEREMLLEFQNKQIVNLLSSN